MSMTGQVIIVALSAWLLCQITHCDRQFGDLNNMFIRYYTILLSNFLRNWLNYVAHLGRVIWNVDRF